MGKLACGLAGITCWVGCALLAEAGAKLNTPIPFLIFLSALGWLFLSIAVGGKKGAAFGTGVLIFAACSSILFWIMAKMPRGYISLEPEGLFFWFGMMVAVLFTFILPVKVVIKLWKRADAVGAAGKQTEKKEEKEKEGQKKRSEVKARGRIGIG